MAETESITTKGRKGRKKLLVIIGVVLVLFGALGAGIAWRGSQSDEEQDDPTASLPTVASELQDLRGSGDEEEFDQKLDEALADPDLDDETRYQVYIQKGHAAYDLKEWQEAIDAYRSADDIEATMETSELLAQTYWQLKDYDQAINYYEKAITQIPDDEPRRDSIKDTFELYIDEIEADRS